MKLIVKDKEGNEVLCEGDGCWGVLYMHGVSEIHYFTSNPTLLMFGGLIPDNSRPIMVGSIKSVNEILEDKWESNWVDGEWKGEYDDYILKKWEVDSDEGRIIIEIHHITDLDLKVSLRYNGELIYNGAGKGMEWDGGMECPRCDTELRKYELINGYRYGYCEKCEIMYSKKWVGKNGLI